MKLISLIVALRTSILSVFGEPSTTRTSPNPTSKRRMRAGGRVSVVPQTRSPLPRVRGPASALRLIADMTGQISSIRRKPDARDLEMAWLFLGHPAGDFVKVLVGLEEAVPLFRQPGDEEAQLDELIATAIKSPRKFIAAIWREVPLRASKQSIDLLARQIQRHFKGVIPNPVLTDEYQWHLLDQYGRPLIARLSEDERGRLEILDGSGGWLHRETIGLSHWKLEKGWLMGGGGPRVPKPKVSNGDGLPTSEPEPNSSPTKI